MSSLRRFPARTGVATLARRIALTPRMIRVTLAGDGFGAGLADPAARRDHHAALPRRPGRRSSCRCAGWTFPPGAPEQEWRNYTVRRHDPEAGRGRRRRRPARAARPRLHGGGRSAARRARRLCRTARRLRRPRRGRVAAAVRRRDGAAGDRGDPRVPAAGRRRCSPSSRSPTRRRSSSSPCPTARSSAGCTATGTARRPARTSRTRCARSTLPDGRGQVWGAAESRVARDVRDVLRGERGMPRKHVKATGYWLRTGDWLLDD